MIKISIKIAAACFAAVVGGPFVASEASAEPSRQPTAEIVYKIDPPDTNALQQKRKNLSRWHMGAVLYDASDDAIVATNWRQASSENNPAALIHEDPALTYALNVDTHRFIIDLGAFHLVERFAFRNFGAEGKVLVAYSDVLQSPDSKRWRQASNPVDFTGNTTVTVNVEPVDTRYVMVMLDVFKAGAISSFSTFGDVSVLQARYTPQSETTDPALLSSDDSTEFDFATLHSGALISHVGSGSLTDTEAMIDEDIETAYEFEAVNEAIVVLDLQEQREIDRISMLYDSTPGTFNFYFLTKLPASFKIKQDIAGDMAMIDNNGHAEPLLLAASPHTFGNLLALMSLSQSTRTYQIVEIPSSFFAERKPDVSHIATEDNHQFSYSTGASAHRYLVIRWSNDKQRTSSLPALRIYEVNLFGKIPEAERLLTQIPLFEFAEDTATQPVESDTPETVESIDVIPVDPLLSF